MYPEEIYIYPGEFDEFEQLFEGLGEELLLMVAGIIGIVAVVIGLVAIVGYVFQSIGLYTIAKNRGIQNPWLAWLPVGNYWIAGSIADQYQYVVNGAVKNRRMVLLVLSIVGIVVSNLGNSVLMGEALYLNEAVSLGDFSASMATGNGLLSLITSGLEIATFVFWQIALYDLYTSCDPKHNVLFLVLGIFFGVTIPYFIFFSRNKELGMPPRKTAAEEPQYHYQPYETPEEPWDNT